MTTSKSCPYHRHDVRQLSATIERVTKKMPGVENAAVNLASERGTWVYDPGLCRRIKSSRGSAISVMAWQRQRPKFRCRACTTRRMRAL